MSSENSPTKLLVDETLSLEKENIIKRCVKKVPPDGGWGWMVVFGSFLNMTIGMLPNYAFSVLFSPILMSGKVSSTKTAWIFNFSSLIWNIYTLFIGPLSEQFGSRKVAIFGGLAGFLSVFLSAFAPSSNYLFFTFSLLAGIAGATNLAHNMMVVSSYFTKNRGFALGIITVGGSLSTFLAPVTANYLLEHFGYTGAAIIFASITLNQCVGAMFYQPVQWHMKTVKIISVTEKISNCLENTNKESEKTDYLVIDDSTFSEKTKYNTSKYKYKIEAAENKLKDQKSKSILTRILKKTFNNLKLTKYMKVQILALSYFCLIFTFINFQMWIPFVITSTGYSLEMASWCSSLGSLGNIIGRVFMSVLSDRKFFNIIYGFMFGLFIMGSSTIAFSYVNDIRLFVTLSCCWGFGAGFSYSSLSPVIIKVMGIEMFPAVYGVSCLCLGIGAITFGPLKGVVRDTTQNYRYPLWMLGGIEILGALLFVLMPFAEKFDNWKYSKAEKREELGTS